VLPVFLLVPVIIIVLLMATTVSATTAATAATSIFALGSNGSGQLGILHRQDVSVPKPIVFDPAPPSSPIVRLATGGNHTLLLTADGDVYCTGDAASGACGLTSHLAATAALADAAVFRPINLGLGGTIRNSRDCTSSSMRRGGTVVTLMAATWEASIFVLRDDDGRARHTYTVGTGLKGELGQGEIMVKTPIATLLQEFPPPEEDSDAEFVDIAACMSHVVAVLSNGHVYGWGAGRKGQLGNPIAATVSRPRRIDAPFPVARAVCGRDFTVLFAAPACGRSLVLGSSPWKRDDELSTVRDWLDVGASWRAVYVLDKAGIVHGWGSDDHGGLPPPGLPRIVRLALGSEHVVALSNEGDVLAWGWGEHGNCGPTASDAVDVKGTWTVVASHKYIPSECRISDIGAGCATSWVFITKVASPLSP